ncbi:MAG: hypothetical protein SNH88_02125 [Rikenellaceae bacterium]
MISERYYLTQVESKRDEREFINMAKRLYKGCENWVCPQDEAIEKCFSPKTNHLFNGGDARRWLARRIEDDQVVGRIAAFYNNEKAAIEEQLTGGCGFFESIDDQEVATMLFDAARRWLRSCGMEAMDGPINFGQRDAWWGLLVEGFDYEPLYENPYNFPYYKALFENYGFKNYFNQNTYLWKIFDDDVSNLVHERARRLQESPGYTFGNIDMKNLEGAAESFRTIYNKSWANFVGVKKMEREEALKLMNMLKPIIDPNLIFFTYHNGEPVGFFIMVPDLNRLIGRFNGKFGLWQKLQLMWDLKVSKKCDRIFGIIFGVSPEYRGRGVESGMMQAVLDTYIRTDKNRYKTLELAWVGDFNPVMNRMIVQYVGATCHKVHTTYRYLFDREKEFKRCPRLGMKPQES